MRLKEADKKEAEKKKEADKSQPAATPADKPAADKSAADKPAPDKPAEADKAAQVTKEAEADKDPEEADQPAIIAPERGKRVSGVIEFRTEQWAQVYSRRIDDTIAALKSKGVPVFWVGLPSIKGTRSTADAVYLNDLYRSRAEKAGAVYIDVWDGFVDEGGKFATNGPDYEGQVRRLQFGRRCLFHQIWRAQVGALRRARNPPLHEQPLAGFVTVRPDGTYAGRWQIGGAAAGRSGGPSYGGVRRFGGTARRRRSCGAGRCHRDAGSGQG